MKGLVEQIRYVRMLILVQQNLECLNVGPSRAECSMSEY